MFLAKRDSYAWDSSWVGVSVDNPGAADFSMQVCLEGFEDAFGFTPEPGVIYRIEVMVSRWAEVDPTTIDRID